MKTENIGKKIKEYRKLNGLTQEGLGEIADLHYTYISQLERGIKQPSFKSLVNIADAMNIGVDKLLINYDISPEITIQISNITDLLLEHNQKELEIMYTLLKTLTNILEECDIETLE